MLGLAVGHAAHLHVEHVDLAVDRDSLALGVEAEAGVVEPAAGCVALGDAAGDEVDPQLASPGCGRLGGGPVERLGAGLEGVAVTQDVPLLRQHDQLGAVAGGVANEPLGGGQVAGLVGRGVQLDGSSADFISSSGG